MPGQAAKVTITERQQQVLEHFVKGTTVAKRLSQRAHIILLAFAGLCNEAIAGQVDLERQQVGLWRRRWAKAWHRLTIIECTDTHAALQRALTEVLTDAPRPGAPATFTPEQLAQLFAVACEDPQLSNRPITHWTARELADELTKRKIVESISPSHVQRLLQEADLRPHECRYWLNTTEKNPEVFAAQAAEVCRTYQEAPQRAQQDGTHTVSVDEKTGMQALGSPAPTKPLRPGQVERVEFEYVRYGTLCLTANLDVATGAVVNPTLQATRTAVDYRNHIEQTVASDPKAPWVFVGDNLNTHCSADLVRWVAKACGLEVDWGVEGKEGILKNMASRKAFLSDRSHRIRFVYTPKHASWLNQIEIWFGILVKKLLKRLRVQSLAELKERVVKFIEYYNATMAKPFRWTYTGKPLCK